MVIRELGDEQTSNRKYGGQAGAKQGIILDGEAWLVKFPKSTKSLDKKEISYTTTPLSEYIGSHIYDSVGIPVHKTELGIKDGKLVVLCKDFKRSDEEFYEFREIKNEYVKGLEEKLDSISSTSGNGTSLESIMLIMEHNPTFIFNPELKLRFWDMFVVDSLIGNHDRNNGNWGVLFNEKENTTRVAPVYDNGASFNSKMSPSRMKEILGDYEKFKNSVYNDRTCVFSLEDKVINPLKYIESISNDELNSAILRTVPFIDLERIKSIIMEIPNHVNELEVIDDVQKEFYYKQVEFRYKNVLLPTFNKLLEGMR